MSAVKWLSDKVGVTDNGALIVIGKLFEHQGTEIEQRVGADEASIALPAGIVISALAKEPEFSET